MKQCLIIHAQTGSEWDGVSFAVIELSKAHIDWVNKAVEAAKKLKEEWRYSFAHIEFFGDWPEFFAGVKEDCPFEFEEPGEDQPYIKELPDNYEDYFDRPEQTIKYGRMVVDDEGVYYSSYGKHTDEEFWTDGVNINAFIEEHNITIY